ncbi:DUF4236 domain-containing protein [Streptomyces alboflavus]|uniref:DUF4236 domain-containing protein n=1 Tax=Streptomyces alboflavus TaxID=67267 RepID=UPI0036A9060B
MSITFRKSFRVLPGVRVHINGRKWSITVGGRRGHHTIDSDGRRSSSLNLPGSIHVRRDHHRH